MVKYFLSYHEKRNKTKNYGQLKNNIFDFELSGCCWVFYLSLFLGQREELGTA